MGSYRLAWATKVTHSYYNTETLSFIPQLSIYRPLLLNCVSGASKLVTDGPYYQYLKGNRRYYTKWDNLSYRLTEVSSKPHQRYAPAGDGEVNVRWYRQRGYDGLLSVDLLNPSNPTTTWNRQFLEHFTLDTTQSPSQRVLPEQEKALTEYLNPSFFFISLQLS